ncbi:hypothetical protein [Kitasatospora purpeofusca]|uniref:hypothetical protein n=1 Tax=Kitasatospora purpeofusca TaxID=67352 RepID=UPI00068BCA97|nr:hypothetical protein [Kitasatospora purpeofusca]
MRADPIKSTQEAVMTATATIRDVWCLHAATGTDVGVNEAIADLAESIPLDELGLGSLESVVRGIPSAVQMIDTARSDPDDLYITTDTAGGLDHSIWPGGEQTTSIQAGQSAQPGIDVPVSFAQNVSLWDFDSVSSDDLLGSVQIREDEQGRGNIAKLAKSDVEGSVYYVTYAVN